MKTINVHTSKLFLSDITYRYDHLCQIILFFYFDNLFFLIKLRVKSLNHSIKISIDYLHLLELMKNVTHHFTNI